MNDNLPAIGLVWNFVLDEVTQEGNRINLHFAINNVYDREVHNLSEYLENHPEDSVVLEKQIFKTYVICEDQELRDEFFKKFTGLIGCNGQDLINSRIYIDVSIGILDGSPVITC